MFEKKTFMRPSKDKENKITYKATIDMSKRIVDWAPKLKEKKIMDVESVKDGSDNTVALTDLFNDLRKF